MNPTTQRHCAHECRCIDYLDAVRNGKQDSKNHCICVENCSDDTRTHPAAQAPPASSEPMYLISESTKKKMIRAIGNIQDVLPWESDEERALRMDAQIQIFYRLWDNARGPVAQQAPKTKAGKHIIFELAGILSDLPTDEEIQQRRDAAIRAQAIQEQCHRVAKKLIDGVCDPNEDCGQCILCDNAGGCLAEESKQVQIAATEARAQAINDVLDKLWDECSTKMSDNNPSVNGPTLHYIIDSLRSEVGK